MAHRAVKWMVVSAVAFGSVAQARTAFDYSDYSNATVRQLAGAENPKAAPKDFDLVYVGAHDADAHKSISVSHVPTKLAPPHVSSVPTSPPSKPNLPPPPPPKQTTPPPPPITKSLPPPPITKSLPPAPVYPSPVQTTAAPEIDARSSLSAIALLVGGMLVLRGKRSRKFAA